MRLDPTQYVDGWLLFGPQFYEPNELRYVSGSLRQGGVFLDVGAHLGTYALFAARIVGPKGTVIAVEADPATAAELRHNVDLNTARNVRIVALGVSDRVERRMLAPRSATNAASASFLVSAADAVEVECTTLDAVVRESGVARVDLAKLDIEGFEAPVLRRFLEAAPRDLWPARIIVEHYPHLAAEAGDALELLRAHGYELRARHGTNYVLELVPRSSA